MTKIVSNEKSTYKITPNQAHKIIEKLKELIKELKEEVKETMWERNTIVNFSLSKIDIALDTKKIEKRLENIFLQKIKDKKLLTQLQEDLLNTKESLFKFNVTSGVSEKLSQIEILKNHIKYYQIFKECLECETIDEAIDRAKEYLTNSEDKKVNLKLAFYDYNEIKTLLKELNKKIIELEKEITYLNSSNEIEIKIYENTAELIGLG